MADADGKRRGHLNILGSAEPLVDVEANRGNASTEPVGAIEIEMAPRKGSLGLTKRRASKASDAKRPTTKEVASQVSLIDLT